MKTANKEITTYNVPKSLRAKAKTLQSDVAKLIASCATWEKEVIIDTIVANEYEFTKEGRLI